MRTVRKGNIVILTGAGISAESGIRTFRASDGLWEEHHIEDVATPEGYRRDPELVQRFYNARRELLQTVEPNTAHQALARLEAEWPGQVTLVTQNIDDLHERAGSKNVLHMHGELLKARCPHSNQTVDWTGPLNTTDLCHCCQFPEPLRPHVVWFGEMPLQLDHIYQALSEASLFIAIGTSGNVYPAAGLVHEATMHNAHTIEINLEPSQVNNHFSEHRYGPATMKVVDYVDELLSSRK
ncbi:Sir2 family NAD+-dependent deacetylase [Oceanisphaera arctica]|uniref:NAD-dependent protein deacylase n=1 Tax=Oceanisphaera arctica TaxID=641510 RepID=A0A2P5TQG5_9GAMM|nr:Sir2 family NAD+-dependent deacetylase [Oceanisphaera arctica]PPL18020.1 NAD-dependent protein deacylase [Oceanisphaera arctica]GHA09258.1 NAD-dependent protein deacylase [Oceanisphaera arctica]